MWVRPLAGSDEWAFVLLNSATKPVTVPMSLKQLMFQSSTGYEMRDVLTNTQIGHRNISTSYNYNVPAVGVIMYYAYPSQ